MANGSPFPCLASVCGREAEEEEAFRKGTALPSQARNIRNSARRLETFPPVLGSSFPFPLHFSNGSERLESCSLGTRFLRL